MLSKLEITIGSTYIQLAPVMPVMFQDIIYRNH